MTRRAVLAGCGAMAKGWLKAIAETPALRDRVSIVGLVDLDLAAAERLRGEFGLAGASVGSDLPAMLASLKPDLLFDVVIPAARRDVVVAGLNAGCDVLTEKPMAASLAAARDIVETAQRVGRVHAVVQNRRFVDGIRRIRHVIASGTLGQLTGLHADFFVGAHFGGFRDVMQNVLLLDMAIHTFDAARFMAGADPLSVYCEETNPQGSWYAHGAAANALFSFSDGIQFTYRGSWSAEGANTSWESQWRIVGTRGTLLWDGAESFKLGLVDGNEGFFRPIAMAEVPPAPDPSQTHGHASVLADFLDALDHGTQPETAGADNIKSLAMVFGAIESARLGRRVSIAGTETL